MARFLRTTVAIVTVAGGASGHAMDISIQAAKACEHLLGYPTCYGVCTHWHMHDHPYSDEELIEKAEKCYREDTGWEDFKPIEEVVVVGRRIQVVVGVGNLGTDSVDVSVDPLDGRTSAADSFKETLRIATRPTHPTRHRSARHQGRTAAQGRQLHMPGGLGKGHRGRRRGHAALLRGARAAERD